MTRGWPCLGVGDDGELREVRGAVMPPETERKDAPDEGLVPEATPGDDGQTALAESREG